MKRVLWIPDCHVPYEDKRAFDLMLAAAREFRPDVVVILGDFADFYSVSSHSKDPRRVNDLRFEVERVRERLAQVAKLGAARNVFVCGNHEDRLERYLSDRAPELFKMVTIPEVLDLRALGFEFVPYKRSIKVGRIHNTHDTGKAGPNAHTQARADFEDNVVIGHTHRLAYSVNGNAQGVAHVAASFGWLGDVAEVDYMHRVSAHRNWALGFGVGYQEASGTVHIQPVPIVEGRCVVAGKLFDSATSPPLARGLRSPGRTRRRPRSSS